MFKLMILALLIETIIVFGIVARGTSSTPEMRLSNSVHLAPLVPNRAAVGPVSNNSLRVIGYR